MADAASDSDDGSVSTNSTDSLLDVHDDDHIHLHWLDWNDPHVLALVLAGQPQAPPATWHNAPNRPRTLDAGLERLDVHVEHFTRFTAEAIRMMVDELDVPDFFYVEGWVSTNALLLALIGRDGPPTPTPQSTDDRHPTHAHTRTHHAAPASATAALPS